jgi:hypothetical protein
MLLINIVLCEVMTSLMVIAVLYNRTEQKNSLLFDIIYYFFKINFVQFEKFKLV